MVMLDRAGQLCCRVVCLVTVLHKVFPLHVFLYLSAGGFQRKEMTKLKDEYVNIKCCLMTTKRDTCER